LCHSRNRVVLGTGDNNGNYVLEREDYSLSMGKVLFVGESPGENEDLEGRPFVGRAGDLFLKFMEDPGFEAWFVTNVVMCKPPGKDKPKAVHWNACRPRLLEEIRIIDPVIVVALGSLAIKALVGGTATSITRARKQLHYIDIPGKAVSYPKPVICTYHPSGIQRKAQLNPGSVLEATIKALIEARTVAGLWSYFGHRKDKE
jgi:DNA polymerase